MLAVQQQMMKDHLSRRGSGSSSGSNSTGSTGIQPTKDSVRYHHPTATKISGNDSHPQDHTMRHVEDEVGKENHVLWPAVTTIAQELLTMLQTLLNR
jgi:hypothetical protein